MSTNITMVIALSAILLLSTFGFASGLDTGLNSKVGVNAGDKANADVSARLNVGDDEVGRERTSSIKEFNSEFREEFKNLDRKRVKDALSDLDLSFHASAKETTFAQAHIGNGWVTSNESGSFARIFWAERSFIEENETEETSVALGTLKIDGDNTYKLTLLSSEEDKLTFSVYTSGETKQNGTLELERETSFIGFSVWNGELIIGSEEWDVHLATQDKRVRGPLALDIDEKFKTKVKVEGNIELSSDAEDTISDIKESLANTTSNIRLTLEVNNENGSAVIEADVEGELTEEQQELWENLIDEVESLVDSAGADAEIEIEIEHDASESPGKKIGFWRRFFS